MRVLTTRYRHLVDGDFRGVSVAYDTQLEDYVALYRLALAQRHPRYRTVTWIWLIAAVLALVSTLILGTPSGIVTSLLALLLFGWRLRTPERLARKRWRRNRGVRYEAHLDATGFTGQSGGHTTAIEWRAIKDLILRPEHLYLGAGEVGAVIALRSLPPEWTPQALYDACHRWRAAAAGRPG